MKVDLWNVIQVSRWFNTICLMIFVRYPCNFHRSFIVKAQNTHRICRKLDKIIGQWSSLQIVSWFNTMIWYIFTLQKEFSPICPRKIREYLMTQRIHFLVNYDYLSVDRTHLDKNWCGFCVLTTEIKTVIPIFQRLRIACNAKKHHTCGNILKKYVPHIFSFS